MSEGNVGKPTDLPIFFIIGRGRSGSTLLRSLLDAHPKIQIPLESRFVQYLFCKYPGRSRWTPAEVPGIIRELERGFTFVDIDHQRLLAFLENCKERLSLADVCRLIYLHARSAFPKQKIEYLGDKNPRYSLFIPQLIKLFPEARFIHLVRDFRDNVAAIRRVHKKIGESSNLYFAAARWILYNQAIEKQKKKFPDRFHTILYEDLILNPGIEIGKICGFLSIDFHPEMLNYEQNIGKYFRDDRFHDLHSSLAKPFDTSKIGRWREELPLNAIKNIEILLTGFTRQYNYQPEYHTGIFRKVWVKLLLYPVLFIGQLRFRMKLFFYRFPLLMRVFYHLLLKFR